MDRTPSSDYVESIQFRRCAPDRFRVRLHISYDGSEYHGWQRQTDPEGKETQKTVQGTIEKAVATIFGEKLSVVGASRTDVGVHAQKQVAHFDCKKDPRTLRDLRYSLQSLTPDSIVVKEAFIAPFDFHSIATAEEKTYRYSILNRTVPSALRRGSTWWVREPLDLDHLNEASQFLLGTHDFKSFQTSGTHVESTTRTLNRLHWEHTGSAETLLFEIQGRGFLKQMVRNIVGTLVGLQLHGPYRNRQKLPPSNVKLILDAKDRRKAGTTAPAHGLFLSDIRYPPELDNRCHPL